MNMLSIAINGLQDNHQPQTMLIPNANAVQIRMNECTYANEASWNSGITNKENQKNKK